MEEANAKPNRPKVMAIPRFPQQQQRHFDLLLLLLPEPQQHILTSFFLIIYLFIIFQIISVQKTCENSIDLVISRIQSTSCRILLVSTNVRESSTLPDRVLNKCEHKNVAKLIEYYMQKLSKMFDTKKIM